MSPARIGVPEFTFEPSRDFDLIRSIIVHPKLYPHIIDDFSPHPADYQPPEHPAILYLIARDRGELLGFWMFTPENSVCLEIHTCLLPNAWGHRARLAGKEMLKWLWSNTDCQRLITKVPEYNRLANLYARSCGLKEFGNNPASFPFKGKLHNQILLGISRPALQENTCQQQ